MSIPLSELATRIDATLEGESVDVRGCASISTAGPDEVTFLANPKYTKHLASTRAAAVICEPKTECPPNVARLVADDPYFAFRNAMVALHGFRSHPLPMDADGGRQSPSAYVHPDAEVDPTAIVHHGVTIERGARVGGGTVLYPDVYVGPDAMVGADCILFPGVIIYDRCIVGDRVTLHAHAVIGEDGFGYATHGGAHHKIPHEGISVIEDDVEIGSACSIERAAMGETRIGAGTKFGSLIKIGHAADIGKNCLFVSLVGVAGSAQVGDYVVLGGQVGVAGHITVGDMVQVAATSTVAHDVSAGEKVGGTPAVPMNIAKRNALAAAQLHEWVKRVRTLERRVAELEKDG